MRGPGEILLVSCYEMGHQPFALASPLGFLGAAGYPASTLDLQVEAFDERLVARARFIGISVPMHTAMRLGMLAGRKIRKINSDTHICFYGLYASLNAATLLAGAADSVIGGEFEGPLLALVESLERAGTEPVPGVATRGTALGRGIAPPHLSRLRFRPPDRSSLPPLASYARLDDCGEIRLAGSVEASRGCLHHCRHCPIPPVYGGRFFVMPKEIVLRDIAGLVEQGAKHISFADADFLNGPGHSMPIVRSMHARFPDVTFDITTKVEHILRHRRLFPELAEMGCLFVISAVESLSDEVLRKLDKGHTRADVLAALQVVRGAGMALRPSLLSFTPWTRPDDYVEMLEFIDEEDLIDHVDPVYYAIRLLLPPGSLLLSEPSLAPCLGPFDEATFSYRWRHPEPRMDRIHGEVSRLVEDASRREEDVGVTFERVRSLAGRVFDRSGPATTLPDAVRPTRPRRRSPRLTESWFC